MDMRNRLELPHPPAIAFELVGGNSWRLTIGPTWLAHSTHLTWWHSSKLHAAWFWPPFMHHYGLEIVAKELQLDERHPNVHRLFLAVYKNFVEAVDAIDNGISEYDSNQPPRYVNNTSLSSRVGRLNLDWIDSNQSSEREDEAFEHAMELASHEFLESINFHANSWLPARSIIMECLASREDIDHSGEIMVLTRSCPWKLHIFELEEEMKIDPSIKYVIYQVPILHFYLFVANAIRCRMIGVKIGDYTVAVSPDKFESRKPLPLAWRGFVAAFRTFRLLETVWCEDNLPLTYPSVLTANKYELRSRTDLEEKINGDD
ncbi:hypothetical protein GH714_031939 [Hevea brasiliensis]|uniref:Uncharacterized protein n=1 Tax=Hevea brasiliensis TaxID=3981 RepID=A0A6A6LG27_HEVBR|nr:hypothetical protein GH714_031939 [Hevea brasiliensis]